MGKEDEYIKCLIKEMMQLIAEGTLSFEIDPNAELPPHLTVMDSFTQISRWECRKLDMDYTNYTLKFGVMGKKNMEELNKRLEKLLGEFHELRKEI